MVGTGSADTSMHLIAHSADAEPPIIRFAKSRNATIGSHTIVQACDIIGSIDYFGCDGGNMQPYAARIMVKVDGTPGTNDMPGRIEFHTTADGAQASTLAMKINNGQGIYIKCGGNTNLFLQPGLVKVWGGMNGVGTKLSTDFGIASTAKNATGCYTVTHDLCFASCTTGQVWSGMAESTGGYFLDFASPARGTISYKVISHAGTATNVAHRLMGVGYQ